MTQVFKFRLESILKLRQRELETAQQRFAAQQQRLLHMQSILRENHEQLAALLNDNTAISSDVNPMAETQRFAYIQFLKAQRVGLQQSVDFEQRNLDSLRQELETAHRNKRALEILKGRQQQRFDKRVQTKALQETDDLVVQRFGRN